MLLVLDGIGFEEFLIFCFVDCVISEVVSEVIFVFNVIVDGQIIVYYIVDQLEGQVMFIFLVQGVLIGGELDYLDEGMILVVL